MQDSVEVYTFADSEESAQDLFASEPVQIIEVPAIEQVTSLVQPVDKPTSATTESMEIVYYNTDSAPAQQFDEQQFAQAEQLIEEIQSLKETYDNLYSGQETTEKVSE